MTVPQSQSRASHIIRLQGFSLEPDIQVPGNILLTIPVGHLEVVPGSELKYEGMSFQKTIQHVVYSVPKDGIWKVSLQSSQGISRSYFVSRSRLILSVNLSHLIQICHSHLWQ